MGNFKNMDKVKHFTMEIPQVKNKMDKMERKLDVDTIFDKSGGKEVAIGKKSKKKIKMRCRCHFIIINLRSIKRRTLSSSNNLLALRCYASSV